MNRILTFILFLMMFLPLQSQAEETAGNTLDLKAFSALPVLHEGRVKPLDSFARVYLKTFSGRAYLPDIKADQWLADTLFLPEEAIYYPIFKMRDFEEFGLKQRDGDLYSYLELSDLIQSKADIIEELSKTDEKSWTPQQHSLMTHYQNYILYTQMLRSFTLLLPLNTSDSETKSFIDYKSRFNDLTQQAKKIVKRKGTDLKKYSDKEKEIALLSFQLQTIEQGGSFNVLLRLIPDENGHNWLSPWASLESDLLNDAQKDKLSQWQKLATAYRQQQAEPWNEATKNLTPNTPLKTKLYIETIYNILRLMAVAGILYGLSLSLLVITNLFNREQFIKYSYGFLISGIIAHAIHIGLRIYILDRPPVGTLYESILFVALICAAAGAYLERRQKNTTGLLLGSLSGLILLTTATAFASEDTMSTLVAVLNTNFWLATHVLCITIGYGWCLVTALLAHIYLFKKVLRPMQEDALSLLRRNIKTLTILALLFTAVGTILGGIWADQSWGRFWGWDPKENGALLIVLWIIWILHSKISGHISESGFAVGAALLSVIVVLAWFGVNLLSVGLHSYGFISGIAWSIGLFCGAEIIGIGALYGILRQREGAKR